ncbi:DUF6036 family nucleotidyltransferase [Massilia glaciei]|uniref:DUF6036 domain-containing protein n=1 Tax=Massilia glaciei TaxID=1524097 RepID=A0A2U2HIG6_9BURK|nr:DUF6036 family nucleotidyltransferase [Massilia glaciei]PWF46078.1 hypothetical protein C7C56_016290 [Massilia glaciei]
MVKPIEFATETGLARGLQQLIVDLQERTKLRVPIRMYIAGGMAVHLYTGGRVTTDVDAEFSKKIILPLDLLVETSDGNMLYLDTNYNSSFALLHEDYLVDALKVPLGTDLIEVFVLNPVDLIVSKIARFGGPDASDIAAMIRTFGITANAIEDRAEHALRGYVGNADYLRMNLRDVLKLASSADR